MQLTCQKRCAEEAIIIYAPTPEAGQNTYIEFHHSVGKPYDLTTHLFGKKLRNEVTNIFYFFKYFKKKCY